MWSAKIELKKKFKFDQNNAWKGATPVTKNISFCELKFKKVKKTNQIWSNIFGSV